MTCKALWLDGKVNGCGMKYGMLYGKLWVWHSIAEWKRGLVIYSKGHSAKSRLSFIAMPYTIWQVSLYSYITIYRYSICHPSSLILTLFLARYLLWFFANHSIFSTYANHLKSARQSLPSAAIITYKSGNKCHGTIYAVHSFPLFPLCGIVGTLYAVSYLPIKAH